MQTKKRKSPSLRFRGYTDDWEERKLGDSVALFGGNSFKSQDAVNDGVKWLKIANVGIGLLKWGEQSYLPEFFLEKYPSYVLNIGDYVMALTRPILNHELKIAEVNESNILLNQRVAKLDFKVNKSFGYQLLRKRDVIDFIESELSGTDPPNLSSKILDNILVNLPSTDEQQKIGTFFKQLDNTIALHQRKLDLLKEQKKGFLQKMFPKNGAKVPELRFAGFADDWEERKFSDLYKKNLERNKDHFSSDRTISIATMRFKEEGNGAAENSLTSYKVLREGDVAFEGHTSKRFAFGRFVLNDIGDGIMSPRFTTLRPTEDMPITFWKQYIHYEPIMRYPIVNSTKLGTMMNELVVDEFLNQHILVPELSEQEKIGSFFKAIDNTIALHQRKLDLLKEQKKGYLQKMFV
ncbi:MAG: restriction endonuclease subunit S [Lentilactobacillus hilgardii]|uniref:restriction endonuclease subunit S n=1 Tax=Lactobacillaceae TaxID=33958 RepID=UPI0039E845AD